jgi:hypothetical protein
MVSGLAMRAIQDEDLTPSQHGFGDDGTKGHLVL